jgi:hypothetical protein
MSYHTTPQPGRHHLSYGDGGWPNERPEPAPYPGPDPAPADRWNRPTPPSHEPPPPPQWTPPATAFDPPAPRPAPAANRNPWADPDEPSPDDIFWADVRRQVAYVLRAINAKHCHDAFDRFSRKDALSPQGAVLFYTAPAPREQHGYKLYFVVRLNFTGPEFDNLPQFLHGLTGAALKNIANAQAAGRRWDPRGPEGSIVNGGNLDMPRDATYIGAGVTSLDTEQGGWYTVANSIRQQPMSKSVFDIPGQCLGLLTDGSAIRVARDPNRRVGDDGVTCNKTLDIHRARHWNRFADLTEQGDPTVRAAWGQLRQLQHTLQDYLLPGERRDR